MKIIPVFLVFCLCMAGCRHKNTNKELDLYLEKEIRNRMAVVLARKDSMGLSPAAIHHDVGNLVLLSRDVENLAAITARANAYFREIALRYALNPSDFTTVNAGMALNDVASVLRENELNFFNQLIFKKQGSSVPQMYTAH